MPLELPQIKVLRLGSLATGTLFSFNFNLEVPDDHVALVHWGMMRTGSGEMVAYLVHTSDDRDLVPDTEPTSYGAQLAANGTNFDPLLWGVFAGNVLHRYTPPYPVVGHQLVTGRNNSPNTEGGVLVLSYTVEPVTREQYTYVAQRSRRQSGNVT